VEEEFEDPPEVPPEVPLVALELVGLDRVAVDGLPEVVVEPETVEESEEDEPPDVDEPDEESVNFWD